MVYLLAIATIAGIGALIVPTIVQRVNDLVDAAPGYEAPEHPVPAEEAIRAARRHFAQERPAV